VAVWKQKSHAAHAHPRRSTRTAGQCRDVSASLPRGERQCWCAACRCADAAAAAAAALMIYATTRCSMRRCAVTRVAPAAMPPLFSSSSFHAAASTAFHFSRRCFPIFAAPFRHMRQHDASTRERHPAPRAPPLSLMLLRARFAASPILHIEPAQPRRVLRRRYLQSTPRRSHTVTIVPLTDRSSSARLCQIADIERASASGRQPSAKAAA